MKYVIPFDWCKKRTKRLSVFPVWRTIWSVQNLSNRWKLGRASREYSHYVRGRWAAIATPVMRIKLVINTVIRKKETDRTCWNILIPWTNILFNCSRMFKKFVSWSLVLTAARARARVYIYMSRPYWQPNRWSKFTALTIKWGTFTQQRLSFVLWVGVP